MNTKYLKTGSMLLCIAVGTIAANAQDNTAAAVAAAAVTTDTNAAQVAPVAAVTPDTNAAAPVPGAKLDTPPTLAAFNLIWQRNIFDPSRIGDTTRALTNIIRPVVQRVESFRYCGSALVVGKGIDAFFSGDGAPDSQKLDKGDTINGLIIKDITTNQVTLADPASTNLYVLTDGTGLSRSPGGPWQKRYMSEVFAPVYSRPVVVDATVDNSATPYMNALGANQYGAYNQGSLWCSK